MKKSLELKEERTGVISELEAIKNVADTEKRDLTKDENLKVDGLLAKADDYSVKIERAEKVEKQLRDAASVAGAEVRSSVNVAKEKKEYSFIKAINEFREGNLSGVELEMHQEARKNNNIGGLGIPYFLMGNTQKRTMQTTTTGAEFVPADVYDYGITLQSRMVLGDLATYLYGLSGDVKIPVLSQTSASWIAEGSQNSSDAGTTIAGPTLSPKRISAYMDLTNALLAQGNPSVEAAVREDLLNAMAAQVEYGALSGSGSSGEPTGVFSLSGTGSATAGAPTLAMMLELESDVASANADFGRMAYITSPKGRGALKAAIGVPVTTSGAGAALWRDDNTVNGYMAKATTNVLDTYNTNTESGLVFGRWDDCVIGQFGDAMDILIDPYTQATYGAVRLIANTNWDVQFKRADSFSTVEGITF